VSARPWTFQQGILWAMDFGSAQSAVVTAEGSLPAGSGRQTRIAEVLATESRVRVRVDEARPAALADLARAMYAPEPAARGSLPSAGFTQGTARGAVASAAETRAQSDVARRFETGRRCFVGRLGEEIVTYGWLTIGDESVGELERNYHMQPGEAYIWDCATLPAHRGSGLYGALLSHIVQTLRAEGIRRAWIGANLDNEPSLRAFARAGFQPVVQVV